jgi:hypothetical protein
VQGPQGLKGVTGAQGLKGVTGAQGPQALTSALFYNANNTVSIAVGANLPLTTNGPANSAGFTRNANTVTVATAGIYFISYNIAVATNGSVAINVSGTNSVAGQSISGGGTNTLSGTALVSLAANATVAVRNTGSAQINTAAFPAGLTYSGELYLQKVG